MFDGHLMVLGGETFGTGTKASCTKSRSVIKDMISIKINVKVTRFRSDVSLKVTIEHFELQTALFGVCYDQTHVVSFGRG